MSRLIVVLAALAAFASTPVAAAGAAKYHVSVQGNDANSGTENKPWRTLQRAVDALRPGDTVLVGPGIYREHMVIKRGGTADAPITLRAAAGARVIVSGADPLSDGWTKATGHDGVYSHDWPHRFPINGPNHLIHPADKYHEVTGRAEQVLHEGRPLRQVLRREQMANGTFFVDLEVRNLYVWLHDSNDPSRTEVPTVRAGRNRKGAALSVIGGVAKRDAAHVDVRNVARPGQPLAARAGLVDPLENTIANLLRGDFIGMANRYIERKLAMFPDVDRPILDFRLTWDPPADPYLQIMSGVRG